MLRDLWIDQGRIESLLRQPFRGQPTSLLKGDEYFPPASALGPGDAVAWQAPTPPGTSASLGRRPST